MQTRDPKEAKRLAARTWEYLYATKDMRMHIVPSDAEGVGMSADVSYAPRGDRSRTRVVVLLRGVIVHWASQMQSTTSIN